MSGIGRNFAAATAAFALVLSSSAGATVQPPQPSAQQAPDPWMALSMMTPAGAATLGTAGVAAQADAPPPEDRRGFAIQDMPIPVLAVWLATIGTMIYIATRNGHHHLPTASPD